MVARWVTAVLPRVRGEAVGAQSAVQLRVPLAYHHELVLAVHAVAMRAEPTPIAW